MGQHASHEWHSMKGTNGFKDMQIFFIPIPMAMFGMCVAFMFGATIGTIWGKKHGMATNGGRGWMHYKGWKQGMGWKKWGMGHHHHGYGSPPCCELHESVPDTEPAPEEMPAEE